MKKLGCAKCGGQKMAKGGTKLAAAGIPYAVGAGQTDGKISTMKNGGKVGSKTLKPVPSDKVGLAKLPTAVRNKMGYKQDGGTSIGPSFSDKIKLAAKRVSRNVSNRRAVNQLQKSSKSFASDRSKADALYNKAEASYNKAVDKNKAINKFKREEGFAPGGDGTYFGNNKYSKPGPIFSKQRKGGVVRKKR